MKDLKKFISSKNSNIKQAITLLEENGSQIVLIIANKKIIGTVTDGDIRRALLRGETLSTKLDKIMNKNFEFLNQFSNEKEALKKMRQKTLRQIPILDKNGNLVDLFLIDELIKQKYLLNDVVIMLGGEGKRLGSLTKNCPKPMLKIYDKPILEIILERCINAGFKNFYFSVRYLKDYIKDYFKDGSKWNIKINYIEEEKSLGTAGSLSMLSNTNQNPILVLNGDVLTNIDYNQLIKFHSDHPADISLCVRKHITEIPYGTVNIDDLNVIDLEEKPKLSHYINAGIYLLEKSTIDLIPKNTFFDMTDLIKLAKKKRYKVNAFPIHEYWQDIGIPKNFYDILEK